MFGIGRGGAPSQLSESPGYPGSHSLTSEPHQGPGDHHHQGPGDQHTSETPPHTPPNSLKMTGSQGPGLHMGQSSEAGVSSYLGGHVQTQAPHGLGYTGGSGLGYNTAGLHDTSLSSLGPGYEAEDKSMVPYNNDSINNIYNGTNNSRL